MGLKKNANNLGQSGFYSSAGVIQTIDSEPACPIPWLSINWMGHGRGFEHYTSFNDYSNDLVNCLCIDYLN
jgi:hypothetical protein